MASRNANSSRNIANRWSAEKRSSRDHRNIRACICEHLRRPRIDSENLIPPAAYVAAWRAGNTKRIVVLARQAGN
jgi:hypothetical protein